jgi:hypothetical protein
VPRIAVTGHMNLTPDSEPVVSQALKEALARYSPADLVGISCIARGADSIFAEAVLDLGGALEVVVPSTNYRETKVKPDHATQFDALLSRATTVHTLPHAAANRQAYEAANEVLVSTCDVLFAVWDGQSGVDKGSTASLVDYARRRNVPVQVIWPAGAARHQG